MVAAGLALAGALAVVFLEGTTGLAMALTAGFTALVATPLATGFAAAGLGAALTGALGASLAAGLAGALAAEEMDGHLVRAVTVGPARLYQDGEVARALGVPVLGSVAWDPRAAAVYAEGAEPARRGWTSPAQTFAASAYLRSIAGLGERARHLLAAQPTRPRSEVGHG